MTDDAFIRMICARPKDDGPRLVYADWLEEQGEADRAELIRIQISEEISGRAGELLETNPAWAFPVANIFSNGIHIDAHSHYGYLGMTGNIRWRWRRGFIDTLIVPWAAWARHHVALIAATPVTSVDLATAVSGRFSPPRIERSLPHAPWSIRMVARWEANVDPFPETTMYTTMVYSRREHWDENSVRNDFVKRVEMGRSLYGFLSAMWPGIRFKLPDDSQRILRMTNSINFIETILSEE